MLNRSMLSRSLLSRSLLSRSKTVLFLVSVVLLSSCATTRQGQFVVRKAGNLDFSVSSVPDKAVADETIEVAAFEVCKRSLGRNFKITAQESRGVVQLAKVQCIGDIDPFATIKFGDPARKFNIRRADADADSGVFVFDYR